MNKYINLDEAADLFRGIDATMVGSFVADTLENLPTIEVSEDCISKAYLEQGIENQVMTVNDEYWRGWNNALDKVVELIEDAPSVIPKTQIETQNSNENSNEDAISREWLKKHKEVISYTNEWRETDRLSEIGTSRFCPNCGASMKASDD